MAVLTAMQAIECRNRYERSGAAITLTKAQENAVFQAIEDAFEAARPSIVTAINTATGGNVTTAAQKKALVRAWLMAKFEIEA